MNAHLRPDLCTQCGGACCKTLPGATLPFQFGNNSEDIRKNVKAALLTEKYIIDGQAGQFKDRFWTLRPAKRNGACVFLDSSGCTLSVEQRPAACLALIPSERFPQGCHQPVEVTMGGKRHEMVYYGSKWASYKPMLQEIVKELECGK